MLQARDYATYTALVSNLQGRGGEVALARLRSNLGNRSWVEFCQQEEHL